MKIILLHAEGLFSAADTYSKSNAMLEIIIMLLVAFVLGYLLRFFIGKNKMENSDHLKVLKKQEDEHKVGKS